MADQNEIKKLLDDPNVTPDTKKQLVRALAGAGGSEEDVNRYAKANGVEVPDDPGFWSHAAGIGLAPVTGGLSEAYVMGKEAKHGAWTMEGEDADKLVKKAGEERELGSTQKVLNETGDFKTSDELLDAGAPGLRFFEKFIPVYQKAAPVCGHNGQAPDLKGYIYKNYDEVREIDFGKFREDADKIHKATETLDNHENEMTRAWGQLGSWEGDAANAARAYHDKFNGVASGFIADTGKAPGTLTAFAGAAQKKVKEFAQHVHDQYNEKCGGLTVEEAEKQIRIAQGNINEGDFSFGDFFSGIWDVLKGEAIGIVLGGPIGGLIGSFMGWANHAKKVRQHLMDEAKQKLQALCQEFDSKKQAFDGYCKAVQDGVKADYDTMFAALDGQIKDKPFGQVGDPPPFQGEQGGKDKVKKPQPDGPGTGGGGGGGGGPSGGGGGGGTPEIPKPENPLDKDGDGKPDVPGDTDGDGKPDDLDGDGKPDQPKPEKELETVTVKSGDNTIKLTEPDSNGHMKMTIDTPKGEPKTYDLDFSKNPEAAKALMGQNGTQAIGNLAQSVQSSQAPGAPAPNSPTAPSGNTPAPGGGGAPGSPGNPIPVEVGADGKIHIEQDGVNFTAEVDPKTGEIDLTIDNGDGSPDQIGVEFGEDENPAAAGQDDGTKPSGGDLPPLQPDTGLPDNAFPEPMPEVRPDEVTTMPAFEERPEFTTMPAQAENPWSQPGDMGNVGERVFEQAGRGYIEDNGIMPSFGEPKIAATDGPVLSTAHDSTATSGVSLGSGHSAGGDSVIGGSLGGNSSSVGGDSAWSSPEANKADSGSQFGTNTSEAGQAGNASLPSMQDGAHGQQSGGPGMAGGMGGGAMMGGGMMGGAGGGAHGGGQGGGDTERGASQWRTTGSLFDDDSALSRVQGVLGDDSGGR
ncbi:hypothetical protein Lesp02_26610 [Lentzea sp. NBRC 105346]|uniref:hypothetical protein n=1 Tax=Lentzea sp. NBRC 105346 TaxID=3032205 RepID=UPI0025540423|nr:hypothetical protein [Lentzea sp. NBRC 105346]GLZ30472.1 hypothetical protein Lesp02_26610 [Lentzea sp. NBRC 105346]